MHLASFANLVLSGLLFTCSGLIYDGRGAPQGYGRESRPGQVDLYDRHSRRLGYGRQGRDGTVELFDKNSRRILTIKPERAKAAAVSDQTESRRAS